jgi:hypothetical protein
MAMLHTFITTSLGTIGGGLAGRFRSRRRWRLTRPNPLISGHRRSSDAETEIDAIAASWAVAHDLPEAKQLIASKLRLGMHLQRLHPKRKWTR